MSWCHFPLIFQIFSPVGPFPAFPLAPRVFGGRLRQTLVSISPDGTCQHFADGPPVLGKSAHQAPRAAEDGRSGVRHCLWNGGGSLHHGRARPGQVRSFGKLPLGNCFTTVACATSGQSFKVYTEGFQRNSQKLPPFLLAPAPQHPRAQPL